MTDKFFTNTDGRTPQADHLTENQMAEIRECQVDLEDKKYTIANDFFELAHVKADLHKESEKHKNLKRHHEEKMWNFQNAIRTIDAMQIAKLQEINEREYEKKRAGLRKMMDPE